MSLTYLASPYSHKDKSVMAYRYQQAVKCAGKLMSRNGFKIFAPIVHSHPISLELDRAVDHEFWMKQDIAVLKHCANLLVLNLDGWDVSKGVAQEIAIAHAIQIPVNLVNVDGSYIRTLDK